MRKSIRSVPSSASIRGQAWNVVIQDYGSTFLHKTLQTKAPSGSFEAKARPADRPGLDAIQATATNAATGESCTATLSV
jgi:hypothetical protein